ncbi:MAG: PilZ domain-containing protein [Spirochaetales bacterium]|nr:PilZ domain-containing protein [Spirochaetales bacterium]
MSIEQRQHPRLPLDVEVDYRGRAIARSRNISKEGICLISEEKPEEGKILNLQFFLPGADQPIQAYARVMWVREASEHYYEFGLKYWEIDEADEKRLEAYFRET